MFLVGMMLPWVGQMAVVLGTLAGFAVAIAIGYSVELSTLAKSWGVLPEPWHWLTQTTLSFTWVMPCAIATTLVFSAVLGLIWRRGE